MAITPAPPFPKTQGDIIRSSDWNDLVVETQRLDNDKVNKAGDAMTGPLTIDGNVGIGTTAPKAKLDIAGDLQTLTGSNPMKLTAKWSAFPDSVTNQAEISNDTASYKTLMIVGNKSAGLGRRVSVWDRLEVNGTLTITGNVGIGTTNPQSKLHVAGDLLGAAKDTAGKAMRICVGSTKKGKTNWIVYSTSGVYVDVNTSSCQFKKTPIYITSLHGTSSHWFTTGGSSVYGPTKNGFRIYVRFADDKALTPAKANQMNWHIQWVAIGE